MALNVYHTGFKIEPYFEVSPTVRSAQRGLGPFPIIPGRKPVSG